MNLSSKAFDLNFLSSRFEQMTFQLFVSDDENSFISCISCSCHDAELIVENWTAIQNFISAYYQPKGEWAMWNIYLAFFCVERVPLWDKYVIENDKYAVRKLISDNLDALPNIEQIVSVLNNQLLGADLNIDRSKKEEKQEFSFFLSQYVRGTPLDGLIESKVVREQKINEIIGALEKNENKDG